MNPAILSLSAKGTRHSDIFGGANCVGATLWTHPIFATATQVHCSLPRSAILHGRTL